jgi:hypothetical protein
LNHPSILPHERALWTITGRTYLFIVKGYLDVLEKEHKNPIAHFEKIAKKMTDEVREKTKPIQLSISIDQTMPVDTDNRKNISHVAFSHLYHQLELDYFINNRRRYTEAKYNHNATFEAHVLDKSGDRDVSQDGMRIKSRIYPREIYVSTLEGKKKKISFEAHYLICFVALVLRG